MTARLAMLSLVCLAATIAIGALVAPRPPSALDQAGFALRGEAVPLALFFTSLGRWWATASLGVLAFGIAMTLRAGAVAVAVLLAAQVLSQATTALLKIGLHRIRPGAPLGPPEADLSYPSGHAVTALVFFVGFAILAWHAPIPRPVGAALAIVLVVCAIGIPWSRLALGAHYVTDVIGGLLFGAAWLCIALAAIARFGTATAPR